MSQEVLGAANTKQLDELFYKLERDIWIQVKAALDISDLQIKAEKTPAKKKIRIVTKQINFTIAGGRWKQSSVKK